MGNRKCFSAVNLEIVSDCVCDVGRAVGGSTESCFLSIKGLLGFSLRLDLFVRLQGKYERLMKCAQ